MEPSLSTRRVFIVGSNSMFEDGIAHLLTSITGLQVSTAKYLNDIWFLEAVVQSQPDVIVLVESDILNSSHLLGALCSGPTLTDLSIVIIRLTSNMVDVYELSKQTGGETIRNQRQFNLTHRDEFVAIARGDFTDLQNHHFSLFSVLK